MKSLDIQTIAYSILINGLRLPNTELVCGVSVMLGPKKISAASVQMKSDDPLKPVFGNDKLLNGVTPGDTIEILLGNVGYNTVYKGKITGINARSKDGALTYTLQCLGPAFEAKKSDITVTYGNTILGFNLENEMGGNIKGELVIRGSNLVFPGSKIQVQGIWQDITKELVATSVQHEMTEEHWVTTIQVTSPEPTLKTKTKNKK